MSDLSLQVAAALHPPPAGVEELLRAYRDAVSDTVAADALGDRTYAAAVENDKAEEAARQAIIGAWPRPSEDLVRLVDDFSERSCAFIEADECDLAEAEKKVRDAHAALLSHDAALRAENERLTTNLAEWKRLAHDNAKAADKAEAELARVRAENAEDEAFELAASDVEGCARNGRSLPSEMAACIRARKGGLRARIAREAPQPDDEPLSPTDQKLIDEAWEKHKAAGPQYRCTRCGKNELQARHDGCDRGPCPMEYVGGTPPEPAREAEALRTMADGCCSAVSPCSHQKRDPYSICDVCQQAAALGGTP